MLDVEDCTATHGFFKLIIFHFDWFFRLSWRTAVEKTSMSARLAEVALSWQRCCAKYSKLESYVSWPVCLTSKNHGVSSAIPKVYFSARIFFQELFLSMVILLYTGTQSDYAYFYVSPTDLWTYQGWGLSTGNGHLVFESLLCEKEQLHHFQRGQLILCRMIFCSGIHGLTIPWACA